MSLIQKTIKFKMEEKSVECFLSDSIREMAHGTYRATRKNPNAKEFTDWNNPSFIGREFSSLREAVNASIETWQEGLETIMEMINEIKDARLPTLTSRKRKRSFNEHGGDEIDLDKMRSGQAYWNKPERQKVAGVGTMTIIADIAAVGAVRPKEMLWRGAAAIALTHLLEEAGYRVKLLSSFVRQYCYLDRADKLVSSTVKDHRDPLNIGVAASAVSAWYFRTVGFNSSNMCENRNPRCPGHGRDREGGLKQFLKVMSDDETNFIVQNIWNESEAIEFVRKSADAIEKGQISAVPWAYSLRAAPPIIIVAITDPSEGPQGRF